MAVGTHSLYYSCGGNASGPSVIFLAGLGGDHSLWPIADAIRGRAYVCTYDRFGDGLSSRPDFRTTAEGDLSDLQELVEKAPFRRPATLVGHSYGGLLAYFMARSYPDEIDGLLLVDASHPDQRERFETLMTDEERALFESDANPPGADQPRPDMFASLEVVDEAYGTLGDMPLTVLTATNGFNSDGCTAGLPCDEMQQAWLQLQKEYAALSEDATHFEIDTGHYIQDEKPDLVVTQILALLDRL
ncbi:MAG: alpha/beta hydrolase [Candidatus Limnocylindrales bacterium]